MEQAAFYLLKSAAWLTGFTLLYLLFLRKERFFMLKRIYLLSGLVLSLLLPLVTLHYRIELPAPLVQETQGMNTIQPSSTEAVAEIVEKSDPLKWFMIFYAAGILFLLGRTLQYLFSVYRTVRHGQINREGDALLVRTEKYTSAFSFFNYVFINPSLSGREVREILNHEMVHLRQKHWFDLLLVEVMSLMQWVNPFAWICSALVRQNHEHLADEEALQRSSDPAVYRAVLLNQIAGSPVIDLGNFFSYSLNKKRFQMMKNKISSPYRKLRLLLILPVAALVLYAFAEPQYRTGSVEPGLSSSVTATAGMTKNVSGVVTDEKGNPLEGAVVVIKGTTVGTTTDVKGKFALKDVPDDAVLVISYVGFETKAVMVKAAGDYIKTAMKPGNVITGTVTVPPPPPASSQGSEKAKVVPQAKAGEDEVFMVVEEMPEFPGGPEAMIQWIGQRLKYPEQAKKEGITGRVFVSFTVDRAGKVKDIDVTKSAHPLLDAEAVRVIGEMPDWNPGSQKGKKVDVKITVPVQFNLQ